MEKLTVQEVAELKGCAARSVHRLIATGQLRHEVTTNERNRKMYLVPLDALEPKLQQKYRQQQKQALGIKAPEKRTRALDTFTAAEREEIGFWITTLEEWQRCRNMPGVKSKLEVDERYILLHNLNNPEVELSSSILYRKWAAYRDNDLEGLLDKRGKWQRQGETPDLVWQVFDSYYLDQAEHPVARCVEYTRLWLEENEPELAARLPSYSTFRRHAASMAEPVKVLGRKGEKAYYDRCSAYIRRTYEDMASNDWWIADNHTFDVLTQGRDGKRHRLHLTAFFDARSGIFTGCHVTDNPCSQATLIALRKGIQKYGIPRNIYVDNGREFLTYDIGGLGHRAKKTFKDGTPKIQPPGVFERLGINMTNAIVRNARAKVIERRFRDVKDHLSRLFETYTGGNVLEKPDQLKGVLKDGLIPTDERLIQVVDELMDHYFNQQPYNGAIAADKGLPRIDVFWKNLTSQRLASPDELNLMLMRSSRPQKVGRRGVHITIAGTRIDYISAELRMEQGKEVYVRYDPENLDTVRVYNLQDQFLMEVPRDATMTLSYGASQDDVKRAMADVRKHEKVAKAAVEARKLPLGSRKAALELVLAQALDAKEAHIVPQNSAQTIELQRATEQPLLEAVGGGAPIDFDTMIRNAAARQDDEED